MEILMIIRKIKLRSLLNLQFYYLCKLKKNLEDESQDEKKKTAIVQK